MVSLASPDRFGLGHDIRVMDVTATDASNRMKRRDTHHQVGPETDSMESNHDLEKDGSHEANYGPSHIEESNYDIENNASYEMDNGLSYIQTEGGDYVVTAKTWAVVVVRYPSSLMALDS
jgi:hypothetical protein